MVLNLLRYHHEWDIVNSARVRDRSREREKSKRKSWIKNSHREKTWLRNFLSILVLRVHCSLEKCSAHLSPKLSISGYARAHTESVKSKRIFSELTRVGINALTSDSFCICSRDYRWFVLLNYVPFFPFLARGKNSFAVTNL